MSAAGEDVVYFAYGSNLDTARMLRRCPGARVLGPAMLPHHRLLFAGHSGTWQAAVATVVPATNGAVPGVLYALPTEDVARLDRYEGAPRVYQRVTHMVRAADGTAREAQVYLLPEDAPHGIPAPDYVRLLFHGRRAHGLDHAGLLAQTWTDAAPDPARPHRVFVYGTLLAGEDNAPRLGASPRLGMSETAPEYRLVDLGPYPALCEGGGTAVLGEVYAVDDATLAALDALEGHPNWYRRTRVTLADERAAELFLYLDAAKGRTIADGDWRWHRVGDAIRGRCHGNINVDGRSRHSGTSTQT